MERTGLDLTREEAAIGLSILLALADDNPSDEEVVVLRKYYHAEAVKSLITKLENAGYEYPAGLKDARVDIVKNLQKADKNFRKRTMAVALLLAEADGVADQKEMNLINKFSHALGVTLFDAKEYGAKYLKEIDEVSDYFDIEISDEKRVEISLTPDEAGIALCTLVAFSDDDPDDTEVGVIREYYSFEAAQSLQSKVVAAGYTYPEDLPRIEPDIMSALALADRETQLKNIAIAHKVSMADGVLKKEEVQVLEKYCLRFGLGMIEAAEYFKTSLVRL